MAIQVHQPPFRQVNSTLENFTVEDLYDKYFDKGLVKADLAFQSSEFTRWKPAQGRSFITSLMSGMAPSKFIFADVYECYNAAVAANEPDKVDMDYFEYWIGQGIRFLNIDSNNRVINITGFINGDFGVEEGYYTDIAGRMSNIIKDTNDRYDRIKITNKKGKEVWNDGIPSPLQKQFLDSLISVQIYEDCNREELSRLFIRINDGQPLNPPEMRNAETSKLAATIREITNSSFDLLLKHGKFTSDNKIRRGLDDFVTSCCYLYYNGVGSSTTPADLMFFYKYSPWSNTEVPKFAKAWKAFMHQIVKHVSLKDLSKKNNLFDLWHIFSNMEQDHYYLDKSKQVDFIHDYIDVVGRLYKDDTMHAMPTKPTPKTFETMIGGRQMANNIVRNELILAQMDLDKYFVKRAAQRGANPNQKLSAAVDQGWKTAKVGKHGGVPIERGKLHDGDVYEGGHDVPWSEGGETSHKNTVIHTKEENDKQGTKRVTVVT